MGSETWLALYLAAEIAYERDTAPHDAEGLSPYEAALFDASIPAEALR